MNFKPHHAKPVSAAVIALAALAATSGAAYASGLPAAASDAASTVLQGLGVVPGSGSHSASKSGHPANHGGIVSNLARTTTETGRDKGKAISAVASTNSSNHANGDKHPATTTSTARPENHGDQISTLATSTTTKGVAKGATISTAASGGKSKAGEHGKAGDHGKSGDQHGKSGDEHGNPTQPDPSAHSNKGGNSQNTHS